MMEEGHAQLGTNEDNYVSSTTSTSLTEYYILLQYTVNNTIPDLATQVARQDADGTQILAESRQSIS